MLPRNIWREKMLGEMWAAVIRTINNLLRTAWLRTRAPRNGDRARVSRCSEGDHEGHICEVPQEEQSPNMCIAQNVCIIVKRNFNLIASIAGKPTSEIYIILRYWCVYVYFLIPAKSPFLSPMYKTCHTITGAYFSQVKNKQWIPWVYTWSWHRRKHWYPI
jgi:hypothetical protein